MQKVSSIFFLLSILIHYILRLFKVKKRNCVAWHKVIGSISIMAMVVEFLVKISTSDFIKYTGFTVIMCLIGLTGILMNKNRKVYRGLHIIFTILFFVYLFCIVKFFK